MRIRGLICVAVGLVLTVAGARAEEVTVVSDVLGPEGPLFVDGNLYYGRGRRARSLGGTARPTQL